MECQYCNAELIYDCEWGVGHWYRENNPEGEIYKCPNSQGFEEVQEALDYVEANESEDWVIERWGI